MQPFRSTLALTLLAPTLALACPWQASMHELGVWAPLPGKLLADQGLELESCELPKLDTVHVTGAPDEVGEWSDLRNWPVIAIHAAALPDGRVLHYAYPDAGAPNTLARAWDPVTDTFEAIPTDSDLFCSGLSLNADGRLLLSGGTRAIQCDFAGHRETHHFDFRTNTFTRRQNMSVARWYPQHVKLADGDTIVVTGLDEMCYATPTMERITPGGQVSVVPGGRRTLELYPRMHLLSSGLVAHVGPERDTYVFDPANEAWQFVTRTQFGYRWDGTSFLVPGETDVVMTCGGNVSNTCERIDFKDAQPEWEYTASMNMPRSHANAMILPDGKVMIIGGGRNGLYEDPILNAEIYDPQTDTWTLLPAEQLGRMYHSTAVLLADGRVLSAGQDYGQSTYTAEIYRPAYLYRGARPVIANVPTNLRYGRPFAVATPDAASISRIALISLTTATHSVNNGQRYVEVPFIAEDDTRLRGIAPAHGNLAPPGHYMLFILNQAGVPSVAKFVRIG